MSDLVPSPPLSTVVPIWNCFQANLTHHARIKTSKYGDRSSSQTSEATFAPPVSCLLLDKWPPPVATDIWAAPLDLHGHKQ